MSREDAVVLDTMETPDGIVELVAYRERDVTWVGLAKGGDGPLGAIGLRTGSSDHQVESTGETRRGWGIAFGAVAPGIVRAEVRNEVGEAFPARIVALPEDLDAEYRAAWGRAERCRDRCELVGFDDRGHVYDRTDPRVPDLPPSDRERLDAIRAHVHGSVRYYATAYHRVSEEDRRRMDPSMHILANVLALLDRDGLDDRSMLSARGRIVQQYLDEAKTDPWEPGSCSFCGESPVAAWFEGPTFTTFVRSSSEVRAEEAWLACAPCLALVEAGDRAALAAKGAGRLSASTNEMRIAMTRSSHDEGFWGPRDRT